MFNFLRNCQNIMNVFTTLYCSEFTQEDQSLSGDILSENRLIAAELPLKAQSWKMVDPSLAQLQFRPHSLLTSSFLTS